MNDPINVGLGEVVVSRNPNDILVAYGLGSCLGISMIEQDHHVCGLLHAVLPIRMNGADPKSAKFVDSGVENLLSLMIEQGADRRKIVLRMAGGANMLIASGLSTTFDIGTRNITSARQTFQKLGLPLKSEDVGGNLGRTVRLYVTHERVTVRVINGIERDL